MEATDFHPFRTRLKPGPERAPKRALDRAQSRPSPEAAELMADYSEAIGRFDDLRDSLFSSLAGTGDADRRPNTFVSQYRLINKLASGGMSDVYLALDVRLERPVVLKFLRGYMSADYEARARLVREARAVSVLDHPNIVTVHEIGTADPVAGALEGDLFLVMSYCEGETLQEQIARGPLPFADVREIGLQILYGLQHTHEHGVVHRDIKPGNLILTVDGRLKIIDFGLAMAAGCRITRGPSTIGTLPYMSPEQATGAPVDHRTDLWSLGVVLYEMTTGLLPFGGSSDQEMTDQITKGAYVRPSRMRRGVPEALEVVIDRCLQVGLADRYESAAEVMSNW